MDLMSDSGVLPSFRSLGSWFGVVRAGRLGLKCCDSFPSAASFVLCARRRRGPRCSCLSHLLFTRLLWLFFSPSFLLAFAVRIDGSRIHVRVGSARDPSLHRSSALMCL